MANQIVVKLSHSQSKEAVDALLTSCFGDGEQSKQFFLRGNNSPNNLCTFEARCGESLVGLIVAWRIKFHPFCTYISIAVNPYIKNGTELILLEHVENYVGNKGPLQTVIWETSYALKNLYEKNGFLEIRRTYMSPLQVSVVPNKEVVIKHLQSIKLQHSIKSFEELIINKALKYKLIEKVKDVYQKTHTENPLGVFDAKTWEQLIFGEDTVLDGSYIILSDNEIIAYSLLHTSETPNELEFGWRGKKDDADFDLILYLTAHQIEYAKNHGYEYIISEIDTTDPSSLEMLKFFPFSPTPTLITYQKK